MSEELLDAEELVRRYTVEELAVRAEQYFAAVDDWTYHLAKPFGSVTEAPLLLAHFAGVLSALDVAPVARVLDFGAGSCWTSHMLAQLGCSVIACDVSPTALRMGRRRFEDHPVAGLSEPPEFLVFDGHRLDLPDRSVDRICCMDAFHHVPNWEEVLAEFHRVLIPGGRAVLAEGGPNHSRTPQAQHEMRNFEVVERDLVVDRFARLADDAGFADTRVGVYAGLPWLLPAEHFEEALDAGSTAAEAARHFLDNHRLVVLIKAGAARRTSRSAAGLAAHVVVEVEGAQARAVVTNTGEATWLGSSVQRGAVHLGVQRIDRAGRVRDLDFLRVALHDDPAAVVETGEVREVRFAIPPHDDDVLAFDLVAEGVAWFAGLGTSRVEVVRREATP